MIEMLMNSWFSRDVTAAMLVYSTMAKKVFWEFDSIFMQNLNDILPLFCTPTWPSHHVSENQEFDHNDDVVVVDRASDGLCKFQARLASVLLMG